VTPAPLLREERLALLIAEDRVKRAVLLGVLFAVLGTVGVGLGFGGRPDGWFPFLGVPFVMVAAVLYVWRRTRCPRCSHRVLVGRRLLPETCPSCGVRLLKPPDDDPAVTTTPVRPEPDQPV
jgi:DNA-directed RNA polymerase subunit RPC12/RpoP